MNNTPFVARKIPTPLDANLAEHAGLLFQDTAWSATNFQEPISLFQTTTLCNADGKKLSERYVVLCFFWWIFKWCFLKLCVLSNVERKHYRDCEIRIANSDIDNSSHLEVLLEYNSFILFRLECVYELNIRRARSKLRLVSFCFMTDFLRLWSKFLF